MRAIVIIRKMCVEFRISSVTRKYKSPVTKIVP